MNGSTWPVKKTGLLEGNIYHNVPSLQTQNMIQKLRTPFYMCKHIITFDHIKILKKNPVIFTANKFRHKYKHQ